MRAVFMDAAGEITVGEREDPRIIDPTDAVIRLTATCICGSTCGRTAGSSQWTTPRWGTSTSVSSSRSATP
ncbi:hypothetical protein MTP03_40380 [Tsukamurella sp. PLM1]|nr:hypothetical protein MTP03_40380 [Tsukamurella sp. PLM1]